MKKLFLKIAEKMMSSSENNKQENAKPSNLHISSSTTENMNNIKALFGNSSDVATREIRIGGSERNKFVLIYIDGLVNKDTIQNFILESIMLDIPPEKIEASETQLIDYIYSSVLTVGEVKKQSDMSLILNAIMSGETVIFAQGCTEAIIVSTRGWQDRGIQEPSSQTVIRGPKDGFTETLRTNTAQIRRRIKDPNLWIESMQVGTKTKTDLAICYIKGLADDSIVNEVYSRLSKIDVDAILESGYIEEYIQDETYTPFPTLLNTERPDATAAALLEGRIAIVVDGTPFVLIAPAVFVQFFQASEDYYQRFDISTLLRLLRYMSFFLALIIPAAYVAVTTFHQEMLPTPLLVSLSSQRESVPFPAIMEVLFMEITFEILREAGVRMPRAVGSAISIVGALVLGQAAVEAGLVSSAMVIVVSLTAISSFVIPNYSMASAVRILRFMFVILASTFGLYGIILGLISMVLHLNSLRSFGVPYLASMAPFSLKDQKDTLFRLPLKMFFSRPSMIAHRNRNRQSKS